MPSCRRAAPLKVLQQTHLAKGRRAKERRQLPTQSHSHPAAHQNNLSLSPHAPAKGARSPSVETMMMPKKRNSNQPTTTTAASHAILITRPVVPTHSLPQTHHHHYHHYRVLGPAQAKDWQLCQSSPSVRKHHPASCALLNHWAPLFQAPHLPITTTVHTASLTLQQQKHQCNRSPDCKRFVQQQHCKSRRSLLPLSLPADWCRAGHMHACMYNTGRKAVAVLCTSLR
ncbi:hypothetical protein IWX92DRAFT_187021 [Phyllosticta citricarpa]